MNVRISFLSGALLLTLLLAAQEREAPQEVTVQAGHYQKTFLHHWLLGKNWRQQWNTPVRVPVVFLDTLYGGLRPYQRGGGGESKSLRLRTTNGHEYVLRSIDKDRGKGVPPLLQYTPYKSLVQDGISTSHPYAAFAIPQMMASAGLFHTEPRLVYLPQQAALDSFNDSYGDDLYLLEERPSGSWKGVAHLGGFDRYLSSAELKERLQRDNRYNVDVHLYIKARLMDILLADVDRHEGNWRWGTTEADSFHLKPIALDRDQAFFTHNGLLSGLAIKLARLRSIESFKPKIKRVYNLTSHDRLLDAFLTPGTREADWMAAARAVQAALTDSVIALSVQAMPAEVYALSGREIIAKLQQRRNDLHLYASRYYQALVRQVEINGTAQPETFQVSKGTGNDLIVSILRQEGSTTRPYFTTTITPSYTQTLTLYGFGGEDVFQVDSTITRPRIIIHRGVNKKQLPLFE